MQNTFIFILLVSICHINKVLAQNAPKKETINGTYHLLFEERGNNGPSKQRHIELIENNGVQMLTVLECEGCFPAVYTYNAELSNQFGKTVFANSMGLYALAYDKSSLAIVVPSLKPEEAFSYVNFYSMSKLTAEKMTIQKIEKFALKLLDFL